MWASPHNVGPADFRICYRELGCLRCRGIAHELLKQPPLFGSHGGAWLELVGKCKCMLILACWRDGEAESTLIRITVFVPRKNACDHQLVKEPKVKAYCAYVIRSEILPFTTAHAPEWADTSLLNDSTPRRSSQRRLTQSKCAGYWRYYFSWSRE
jgi:hypothetical protein